MPKICRAEVDPATRRYQSMRDENPHDLMLSNTWIGRTVWVQMFSNMDRRLLLKLA
jgi:hypothetical protein